MSNKYNLGMVTAYAYAVVGGYEGTEAEFEALLGNIATDLAEIENLTVIANTLPPGSSATASYDHGVLTLGIPKGDKGDTGAGATVTVGTTATGNPGTNASVTNSGTTKDAVFNFTIPRGDTGNGIESIYLTGTSGAVKTYTILFTDGNTTTFDVTDGEVTNAALTAVLADYAKIDGAYESMTVGNAEQLVSTVFVNDEEPYNFRTAGGSADIGDRLYDTIVGGTVAWNQLHQKHTNATAMEGTSSTGLTITVDSDGYVNISGTPDATCVIAPQPQVSSLLANHVGLILCDGYDGTFAWGRGGFTIANNFTDHFLNKHTTNFSFIPFMRFVAGTAYNVKVRFMGIDLTQMFGSTIADYIYSLETANAGAGVAWFRKLFPKTYYAYNAGELMSVQASSHDMVGFNAFDGEVDLGGCWTETGTYQVIGGGYMGAPNKIKCLPNTTYCFTASNITVQGFLYYAAFDANGNYISRPYGTAIHADTKYGTFTTPSDCYFIGWYLWRSTAFTNAEAEDITINISWDGERDGEYEEYVKHSYPLDSDLVLRGIPKLDASNNLYYDGDVYESDGSVTRRYGIVDLGTLNWTWSESYSIWNVTASAIPIKTEGYTQNLLPPMVCEKYTPMAMNYALNNDVYNCISYNPSYGNVFVKMQNNSVTPTGYLVYELATPTTESADPFQSPQIVDDFGTEEYVDYALSEGDRDVAIPVGHKTKYTNNLRAKLEMSPNSPDGAGDYLVRQTNGINEYVSLASNATIQDIIARLEALEGGGE